MSGRWKSCFIVRMRRSKDMGKKKLAGQVEIELRGLVDEEKHEKLQKILSEKAEDLGRDDKDTYFFLTPKKVFKVVDNISKNTAKIVYKSNRVGEGKVEAEEIEVSISPSDFSKAVEVFSQVGFKESQKSYQKRHNYLYKDVEIALKYTDSWGYHVELEVVVGSISEKNRAENKIRKVAEELGIPIMSENEIRVFAEKIDREHEEGKYE